jgi:hypothetical protein
MEARAHLADEGQKDAIAKTRRAEEDLVVASLNVEHARAEVASVNAESEDARFGPVFAPRARAPSNSHSEVVSLLLAQASEI